MSLGVMKAGQLISTIFLICLSYSSYQLSIPNGTEHEPGKLKSLYTINCTQDRDCLPNSYCYYGRCACLVEYIPDKDTRRGPVKCIKKALHLEDYCEKDIQCESTFGVHSFCQKRDPDDNIGKCNCKDDAHFIDGLCYQTAYIGQKCSVNDNCLIRSRNIIAHCEYSHCICPPLHHAIDGGRDCVPSSVLSGPCSTSDNCVTLDAECKYFYDGGFCFCKNGFLNNFDNSSCLPVASRVGDTCEEDRQCSLNLKNAVCNLDDATCTCKEGHHEAFGECRPTKYLFDKCNHTMECMNGSHPGRGIHCHNNICICMDGFELHERKYCNPIDDALITGEGENIEKMIVDLYTKLKVKYLEETSNLLEILKETSGNGGSHSRTSVYLLGLSFILMLTKMNF